jgi:hypothetical protein
MMEKMCERCSTCFDKELVLLMEIGDIVFFGDLIWVSKHVVRLLSKIPEL